ncbi:transcriptional regulator [Vibrio sp. SCSIO 43136]|uniref:transcriptional regulator n=1 Tax=Vibrio sp. SCSIO 43136 TaxID=2819101 RepID=UPI0020754A0A|nr:transcriptional regulator [Vibrio sp. SCSIO 43136]USD64624.1 transcriptional regulator [Vibrio sp. SCSIO 43136]
MSELERWQQEVSAWYLAKQHHQAEKLVNLVLDPPEEIWGPMITDGQSKAIACWLDASLRLYRHYLAQQNAHKGYQYLNFAYSKLQQVYCNLSCQLELRQWAKQRLEHLIVLMLELCSQHDWHQEANQQIDCHVRLLASYDLGAA